MGGRSNQSKQRLKNLARASMKRLNPDKSIQEIRAELPDDSTITTNQDHVHTFIIDYESLTVHSYPGRLFRGGISA